MAAHRNAESLRARLETAISRQARSNWVLPPRPHDQGASMGTMRHGSVEYMAYLWDDLVAGMVANNETNGDIHERRDPNNMVLQDQIGRAITVASQEARFAPPPEQERIQF